MKHFLTISTLTRAEIQNLMERAFYFKQNGLQLPCYRDHSLALLFYENSTRTRISFELAAKKLSILNVNLDLRQSSENKGEVMQDTINNLAAMGIQLLVIRHSEDNILIKLAEESLPPVRIINAGDGMHEHPSQAILDMMTILEHKSDVSSLKIAVVGDLRHSRVVNSFQHICAKLDVKDLVLVAPSVWQPSHKYYGRVTASLEEGLEAADVVMSLRVQRERFSIEESLDLRTYRRDYAITANRLSTAKKDVMVLHPGPVNRNVEIDDDVVDGPCSRILTQVQNGVFARMAILEAVIQSLN